MYETYFRLRDSPFNLTPDPRFLYANASHREAFATLSYGVERRKGIIVITGEAGTGKTTLLRRFVQNPAPTMHSCYIVDPHLNFIELLRCASDTFGLAQSRDRLAMVQQLNGYLTEQFKKDHIVALLFDEAQDLNDEVFGELRLLSDWESAGENLIQIVLAGQTELESRLAEPAFQQLKQRIALCSRLEPLSREELGPYIQSRLSAAGYVGESLFATSAIERIAVHSKGIPRLINVLCDNALLIACATSQNEVAAETIEEAAGELHIEGPKRSEMRYAWKDAPGWGKPEDSTGQVISGGSSKALPEYRWVLGSANDSGTIGGQRTASVREAKIWKRRYTAYLIVVSCLAGITLFLFRQESAVDSAVVTQSIEKIKEVIAPIPVWIHRTLMTGGLYGNMTNENSIAKSPGHDQEAFQHLELRRRFGSLPTAGKITPGTIEGNRYRNREELDRKRADRTASAKTVQQSSRQQSREEKKATWVVIENSFVRGEPTSNAEIIATLPPGARVQVVGKKGDYWQIRSSEPELVRGYVHQEDAFFEQRR